MTAIAFPIPMSRANFSISNIKFIEKRQNHSQRMLSNCIAPFGRSDKFDIF
jgi:hypothetical protein